MVSFVVGGLMFVGECVFSGAAAGVAADGDRLYVADADRGVRVFARAGAVLTPLGVVAEGTP